MFRLFVAIDLPELVKEKVAGIVTGEFTGARRVPREQLHLTLRFIGEVEAERFRAIKNALSGIMAPPFSLTLKEVGHFPPGKHPRVLWVGVEESGPLRELRNKIELALIDAGVEAEERGFSPHITIARLKETTPARVAVLEEKHQLFAAGPFPVEEFFLYSSTISREGAIHKKEAVYRFANVPLQ
jgi:RNA 2',3'-cyclic 3'-phosphodiesterase